jgi:hypothetical protein
MMKKILLGSAVVVAMGALALSAMGGTAWLDSKGLRGERRLVESRLNGYWDARVAGDMNKLAAYVHPLQGAISDPGMLVTESYTVNEVTVDGEMAQANVTVKSRLKHPILSSREREVEMNDKWVLYQGQWYKGLTPRTLTEVIENKKGKWTPPTAAAESVDVTPNVQ